MKIEFENGSTIESIDRGDSIKSDRYYQQIRQINGIHCPICLCMNCTHNDGKNCDMEENLDYYTCYQCDAGMAQCKDRKIKIT